MELGATPKIKPRKQCVSPSQQETMIDSLPDEVLEHILALVSPYQELSSSARVCSRSQQS